MGQAIGEVLPFAVGVAIVPVPIIAVILMLFSERAKVNGPRFVVGWIVGLPSCWSWCTPWRTPVTPAQTRRPRTRSPGEDHPRRPPSADGSGHLAEPTRAGRLVRDAEMDERHGRPGVRQGSRTRRRSLRAEPKNLVLIIGAAAGVAQLGVETTDALVAPVVFVVVASMSVLGPVVRSRAEPRRAEGMAGREQRRGDGCSDPPRLERAWPADRLSVAGARSDHPIRTMAAGGPWPRMAWVVHILVADS